MLHPDVERTMRTGYPHIDYLDHERFRNANYNVVGDRPVEDMFGSEIQANDVYFIDEERNVVLKGNIRDYLTEVIGVVFYEAN